MNPKNIIRKIFPTARRLLVEKSLRLASDLASKNVLVIGSGHDPYRRHFKYKEMYTCLDIVEYKNTTNIVADAHNLPIRNEAYDCVVAIEVLEHIANPFIVIKELTNVLEPGGVLVLSVPFMYHSHADPFDFWRPTKKSLQDVLEGFSDVRVYSQGNRLHSVFDLITTSFSPYPLFFPLRVFSHFLCLGPLGAVKLNAKTTAPSGYFVVATK